MLQAFDNPVVCRWQPICLLHLVVAEDCDEESCHGHLHSGSRKQVRVYDLIRFWLLWWEDAGGNERRWVYGFLRTFILHFDFEGRYLLLLACGLLLGFLLTAAH